MLKTETSESKTIQVTTLFDSKSADLVSLDKIAMIQQKHTEN